MESSSINLLVSTFPGLQLPRTISLQVPTTYTVSESISCVENRLPPGLLPRLVITTTSNRQISPSSSASITSLLSSPSDNLLNLRLSSPLCGGKGGFGSQLRAAGGRMSSRKKKNQGDAHASSRNLDGRRLRTIKEAKALAEYLAVKPDMDQKEKEERRKRWEQVVDVAEKKQDELKSGGKARLDGKWMEAKDEASEKTREAVLAALSAGEIQDVFMGSDASEEGSEDEDGSESEEAEAEPPQKAESSKAQSRTFFGWDEEELSDTDDEENEKSESKDE